MTENRRVGSPQNNPGRMEPRSVAVQKDKPRINDERKVRPHTSGKPAMGGRPSGGAQKEPVAPPDSLAGEYIQAREVPMASIHEAGDVRIVHNKLLGGHYIVRGPHQTPISGKFNSREEAVAHLRGKKGQQKAQPPAKMTEAELSEWNPFERFMQKPAQPAAAAPQSAGGGVEKRIDRIDRRVDVLQRQMWQMGRDLYPRGPSEAAKQFAGNNGPAPQAAKPTRQPAPPAGNSGTPWGHRGEPLQNPTRDFWKARGNSAGPTAPESPMAKPRVRVPSGRRPAPMPEPANDPEQMSGAMPLSNIPSDKIDEILAMANSNGVDKGFWTPERIKSASELNKRQAAQKLISSKHTRATPMAAESAQMEGYPDTNYEKCNPAHVSKIGDLRWKGKGRNPSTPRLNKNFMQPLELRVEKVTEMANSDMEAMIKRTMTRLGLEEAMHGGPEVDTVTLPSYWASALVNGDFSGLDETEAHQCQLMMHKLAQEGWQVVGTSEDEPRFTWNYKAHNPHSEYGGGEVMDYVIHRERGPEGHDMESYTGSVSRGPQGAAPVAETTIPRTRARWV